MKKKIVCIFVMTLLIATSVQAFEFSINIKDNNNSFADFAPGVPIWQPFVPQPLYGFVNELYGIGCTISSLYPATIVRAEFDWDGGSTTNTAYVNAAPFPGVPYIAYHYWDDPGTYYMKVRGVAKNIMGNTDNGPWSLSLKVIIIDPNANDPPNTPDKPSGPINQMYGTYTYSTETNDPDGDLVAYKFNFDDGSPLEWTPYYDSGQTASVTHTFDSPGIYDIRVKAKDEHGQESGWSDKLTVWMWTMVPIGNRPPNVPDKPDPNQRPTTIVVGDTLTYSTSTTDPDGDKVAYKFDFSDIDYSGSIIPIVPWSGYYISGFSASKSHQWTRPGFWSVKAMAKDIHGQTSDWSLPYFVIVGANDPPNMPSIQGPEYGKKNTQYVFSASATDSDGDNVRYGWDIDGDNVVDYYSDYYNSGQLSARNLIFTDYGQYIVRAIAEDEHSLESDWSDPLIVTINLLGIKSKQCVNMPFLTFLENHPNLFPLLRQILGL